MNRPTTKAVWLSLGVSLGLHILLFVVWFNNDSEIMQVDNSTHTINIQLLATAKQSTAANKRTSAAKATSKNNLNKQKKIIRQQTKQKKSIQVAKTKNTTGQLAATSRAKNFDVLHSLLNNAINQHKHYPLAALRLHQQGKVRISFKLLNNGNVDNLEIAQSSGYHSLDNAALLAVKKIQPFHPAADYIASAKDFQLDILFQL